jgi:hypothetical protein
MRKIVGRVGALMRRRKPGAGEEAAPVPGLPEGQGALPVSGEPSHQERSEDPAPAPGQAVAGPASGPEAVPVPARQERPHRAAPDLVFMLSGQPGQPGIDLSCVHADTGYRLRESHPEALYPDEVEGGDYILDVTGHALSFGPQGRPGAHVFVPVKTHKGSPSSMPRNAAGNALVPIEARIVERIDRETAAVKVRLQRPVVAWVSLRGGADAAVQEAAVADEPKVEALEIEPANGMLRAEGRGTRTRSGGRRTNSPPWASCWPTRPSRPRAPWRPRATGRAIPRPRGRKGNGLPRGRTDDNKSRKNRPLILAFQAWP